MSGPQLGSGLAGLLRSARESLHEAGLRGSILVRDLDTEDELGIDPGLEFPVASLVKVPLAIVTFDRIRRGELDPAQPVTVPVNGVVTAGPSGTSRFRHPTTIALEDLVYLSTSVSDNAAADALLTFTPPAEVTAGLRRLGFEGISVRHLLGELAQTPARHLAPAEVHLAHSLAITATTAGHGHPVAQLDVTRASAGSARAFVDLLQGLWRPVEIDPWVAGRVRELMAANIHRQRLSPDFSSDATRWSSKTGTLLNLRHEVGVVEHTNGETYAVAVLTESRVPAVAQPEAEAVMAQVARALRDRLRLG